jgi:hypothetical protein
MKYVTQIGLPDFEINSTIGYIWINSIFMYSLVSFQVHSDGSILYLNK